MPGAQALKSPKKLWLQVRGAVLGILQGALAPS